MNQTDVEYINENLAFKLTPEQEKTVIDTGGYIQNHNQLFQEAVKIIIDKWEDSKSENDSHSFSKLICQWYKDNLFKPYLDVDEKSKKLDDVNSNIAAVKMIYGTILEGFELDDEQMEELNKANKIVDDSAKIIRALTF